MRDAGAQSAVRYRPQMATSPLRPWFKWLCWFMAAYFAMCVGLQYNDPDPIRWMAIYGAAMVFSIFLPSKKQLALPGIAVGLIATLWGAYLAYRVWGVVALSDLANKMSEKGGAVEEEREAGGLLIEAVWILGASWVRSRRL
jgi:hypothetical protein